MSRRQIRRPPPAGDISAAKAVIATKLESGRRTRPARPADTLRSRVSLMPRHTGTVPPGSLQQFRHARRPSAYAGLHAANRQTHTGMPQSATCMPGNGPRIVASRACIPPNAPPGSPRRGPGGAAGDRVHQRRTRSPEWRGPGSPSEASYADPSVLRTEDLASLRYYQLR